jgi:hypothetical protein
LSHVHGGIKYNCEQCDFKASRKDTLKKHYISVHISSNQYPCNKCDYEATRRDNLAIHLMSKHPNLIYPYQQCNYKAKTKDNLKIHHQSLHIGEDHSCQEFGQQFTHKGTLNRHKKSIHGGLQYHLGKIVWLNIIIQSILEEIIHVRNVVSSIHERTILQDIVSQYMKVFNIHAKYFGNIIQLYLVQLKWVHCPACL